MPPPTNTQTLRIETLGAHGDGVAHANGRKVHVPLTLPGELVEAEVSGEQVRLVAIREESQDRVAPRCKHYGACGGCNLQHLADAPYLAFKRRVVQDALAARGLDIVVDPVVPLPPRSRRRAAFAAARQARQIDVGFHGRRTHTIISIHDCAVLTPGLLALTPRLEALARIAAPPKGALTITATETATGIDVAINGVRKGLPADDRLRLTEAAGALDIARLTVNGEPLVEQRSPTVRAGAAFLAPPPGGFLQACVESEAELVRHVREAVGDARRVADLFCGAGTFSLPLADSATIHAVESDEAALAALTRASRSTPGLRPVTIERRDLFRQPLTREELARFDAIVLDPPRAGAEAQCATIAVSTVKRVAMVACNAATFARDVRILTDGGFKIDKVTPVDQFLYSPHIEIVAALRR